MDDYIKKYLLASVLFMVLPQSLMAAPLWSDLSTSDKTATSVSVQSKLSDPHKNSRRVSVSFDQLKATLAPAATLPAGQAARTVNTTQIDLPMPYGGLQTFNVYESSVMEPELAAKYPEIQSYKVVAVNDPTVTGVLDAGPNGFHAYLNTADGEMFIDPTSAGLGEYYSYYKHDYVGTGVREFSCGTKSKSATSSPVAEFKELAGAVLAKTTDNLISYRIAVATTVEYSAAVADGDAISTLAEVNTAINRVSFIYERDLAIRLLLVANNDQIIYTATTGDSYTNNDPVALLTENQINLDNVITPANYDIGHVFSTGGGGLAGLGVACVDNYKARGETGSPSPTGDLFYIDYVAHEIGHQLSANHTFNGTTSSCGGNRNGSTAFEPGSGSTIMAYAGICGEENSSTASIATFHAGSIEQIIAYTRSGVGNTCSSPSIASSLAPFANAGQNYIIPGGTAFTLTGIAEDIDTAVLTYQWDQMDAGAGTTIDTYGSDIGSNALFRSFLPSASPSRTFPQMSTLLSNVADKAETLPIEVRNLNFRFTARDDTGGVDEDNMQITVDGAASGPFEILQPNGGETLISGSQLVEWNKACTDQTPVNCATVDILLSTDGGTTFPTVLATTPNNGAQSVTIPAGNLTTARIKIACTNNVFFDISDGNFTVNTVGNSPTTLSIAETCGTATGNVVVPDGNDTPATADSLTLPANLSGTVNDALDPDDYFVFVASSPTHIISLSNYGSYDLDLYLYDSAEQMVNFSYSETSPTESIIQNLTVGNTYYIKVSAWDTSGQDSTYTLTVQPYVSGDDGGMISHYWLFMLIMTPLLRLRKKA